MPELTVADRIRRIRRLDPCPPAMAWAAGYTDPALAWAECQDGSWMLWLIGRCAGAPESPARRQLVACACDCAALAQSQARAARVSDCIDTARRWARGEATIEELRDAAGAARAAYAAGAAQAATLAQCADIVRRHYPTPPTLQA